MAIIDRIKFDGLRNGNEWLVYRYPGEEFVMGTQLIVGEGQVAVFVKGGQALDYFIAGTYTLAASNIPLLQGIINLPFGGKTPFTAEIYFINKTTKLDLNWGTVDPIQLIDPKYNIKLRVRAFGQIGMKVDDYRIFLTELIGTMNPLEMVNYSKMLNYFKGILVMKTKSLIAQAIINNKVSALEISASIDDISEYCKSEISEEFDRFGIRVVNFFIQSINFPDEDFEEINKILRDKASFDIIGDSRYVTKRSFDTMEAAAGNEGSLAGALSGAGLGLGVGAGLGSLLGDIATGINTKTVVKVKTCPKCGSINEDDDSFCAECGNRLASIKIECGNCGAEMEGNAKFCTECGKPMIKKRTCPNCSEENESLAKFCQSCGTKLEM